MNEDYEAAGTSTHMTSHMSAPMSSRIEVVGGRRRWSVEQKLMILREAFGPDGSVSATCKRHAIGSGAIYTWRRQALSGDLTGTKRPASPDFAEVALSPPSSSPSSGSGQIGIGLPSGVCGRFPSLVWFRPSCSPDWTLSPIHSAAFNQSSFSLASSPSAKACVSSSIWRAVCKVLQSMNCV